VITRWIDQGMAPGDPSMRRPGPAPAPASPQSPDLVITMPVGFAVPADGDDIFRNFVVPMDLPARRYVRAWEFRPGNAAVVHHATLGFDETHSSRDLDQRDVAPGYEGVVPFTVRNPEGYFLGWSPGQQQPQRAADGMAWPLETGSDLLISMHLRPIGKAATVQASLALYLTDTPPSRVPVMLRLGRQDIDIPAGEAHYVIGNSYTLPVDVDLMSVYPHAHHLAREMRATAVARDGRVRDLLWIRDWDFNWQDVYRYVSPQYLPAGTVVTMEYTYDNSGAARHGPHQPARRVTFGPNSSDEMGDLWLQVVPRDPEQRATLIADFDRKLTPETIAGVEMMIRANPDNAGLHDDAGLMYLESGDAGRALAHFNASSQLHPGSASGHNNVASSLLALRRTTEARARLLAAIAIDPDYAPAHYNLGMTLQLDGVIDEAIREYQQALRIRPAYAEAHYGVAAAFAAKGDVAAAARHYRGALASRPEWIVPAIELAWLLATTAGSSGGDLREARALVERIVGGAGQASTFALDVLAATLARQGDFAGAVRIGEQALKQATTSGNRGLAGQIDRRLELYRRRQAYLVP
jgi:tetratricopeptide (TPR) repeat protein